MPPRQQRTLSSRPFYVNWGTYAFDGTPTFQYTFWRQFYGGDDADEADDHIWELEYTFHFRPDDETSALGSGGEMCADPGDADEFRMSMNALPVTVYIVRSTPIRSTLALQPGG